MVCASLATVAVLSATAAAAAPVTPDEKQVTQDQVAKANSMAVQRDPKSAGALSISARKLAVTPNAPVGSYPTRKGIIMVTSDAFKGLIPTGHAAIIYSSGTVVESLSRGVVTGSNNWNATKSQAYGVTARATSGTQDSTAANWAYGQRGKPYNLNYFDTGTRARFYCSQLVWAAFKDNFGINLDTIAYLGAVHPMELVNNTQTLLVYRKV